ncbi:type II toxin-antitoxin system Phd/YefM family antitoxin [Streptomyces sp. NPDC047917]|uniref:type II toxin-antitoxin system Phd/YefM family antitoxin n=1 Tax=Streptomyces sp. NPDC047917 TaxID=3365491 RepID=UPI00372270DC
MEAVRQYNVHEAKTHLSRILEQVATGEERVIFRSGDPVAEIMPLRTRAKRTERGSLQERIHIRKNFDDLPDDFGML